MVTFRCPSLPFIGRRSFRLRGIRPGIGLLAALTCATAAPAAADPPASMLIWPVNPVIANDARAAALWLENPGKKPLTLQVRIFAWAQVDGENVYAPQDEVMGTPPLVTIAPGQKQLIRLTRMTTSPVVAERAFRVIIDEIPTQAPQGTPGAAVSFRMRYSLPLFISAPRSGDRAGQARGEAPAPELSWRTGQDENGRFLEIRNAGPVHARLVDAALAHGGEQKPLAPGLFGYVLAGSFARWPLSAAPAAGGRLSAQINGGDRTAIPPSGE